MYYLNIGHRQPIKNDKKINLFLDKYKSNKRSQQNMQVGLVNSKGEVSKIIYISDINTWISVVEGLKDLFNLTQLDTDCLQNFLESNLENNPYYVHFDMLLK